MYVNFISATYPWTLSPAGRSNGVVAGVILGSSMRGGLNPANSSAMQQRNFNGWGAETMNKKNSPVLPARRV
jgi:hypothetical protein